MQKNAITSSVLSKQDETKYTISSMSIFDEYSISISNQNYYKLINNNTFVLYKYDEARGEWIFESNNNVEKFLVAKDDSNYKFTISEVLAEGKYRLYILLEEQEYKLNFSNFENGSVKYILSYEDAVNIPDEKFENEVRSGGEVKLSYVDVCALYLSPNSGYYIKTLLINGVRFINEGVATSGTVNYGDGYKISLCFLDAGLFNNLKSANVEIDFQPREDASYTIKIYKENLQGEYEFAEDVLAKGVVNQNLTYEELFEDYSKKYTGFELNEKLCTDELKLVFDGENIFNLYYQRKSYEIVLILNENESESVFVKFEHEYVLPQCEAEKIGHEFTGNWITEGGTIFKVGEEITVNQGLLFSEFDNEVLTLIAMWDPKEYEIVWDGNGATNPFEQWGNYNSSFYKIKNIDGKNYLTSKVVFGQKLIGTNQPLKPNKVGFEFAGWQFDDNNIIDFTQNYSYPRDMTVKTNWNESSVGIQFESQYSFIDLSYSL